jgi:hypothetical protein
MLYTAARCGIILLTSQFNIKILFSRSKQSCQENVYESTSVKFISRKAGNHCFVVILTILTVSTAPHLLPPMASISSMKMMHGVFALAASKRSLTLFAPTPTYISSNSEYRGEVVKAVRKLGRTIKFQSSLFHLIMIYRILISWFI